MRVPWRLLGTALRRLLISASWLVVAALVAVSVFHLARVEPWVQVVALVAVTPWIYMLAWVTAGVGLLMSHRALAICSAVLVALQLWWVVPDFDPISHLARASAGEDIVRVFDENVSQSNHNLDGIAAELRRNHPDVVTMEELTYAAYASLLATGVLDRFPYAFVRATADGPFGMAIWSKFPLVGMTEWHAGFHPELRGWLVLSGGRRLRLDVLHSDAPVGPHQPHIWAEELADIKADLKAEPRPLLAVGDLNATWYDWHFQSILGLGLRDAAVIAGRGWQMTWPRDQSPVVPYLRIDHVLLSPTISLLSYGVGQGQGSDHRPIIVTVALPR